MVESPQEWEVFRDDVPMKLDGIAWSWWIPREEWMPQIGKSLRFMATIGIRLLVLVTQATLAAKISQGKSRAITRGVGQVLHVVSRGAHAAVAIHVGWD